MENLAFHYKDEKFAVSYILSELKSNGDSDFNLMTEISSLWYDHPIFKVDIGPSTYYFDWTQKGFSIRNEPKFKIKSTSKFGDYSLKQVMTAWKKYSTKKFNLTSNNCNHWGSGVKNELENYKK